MHRSAFAPFPPQKIVDKFSLENCPEGGGGVRHIMCMLVTVRSIWYTPFVPLLSSSTYPGTRTSFYASAVFRKSHDHRCSPSLPLPPPVLAYIPGIYMHMYAFRFYRTEGSALPLLVHFSIVFCHLTRSRGIRACPTFIYGC